jgi:hypothetical protein
MSDPNELSEEERKKLNSGFPALTAKVVISGKEEIERLEKQNEELEMKLLEAENQIEKIATKAFQKKKEELGCSDPAIDDPDKLEKWHEEHTRNPHLNPELGAHGASGKAPLSGEPTGQISHVKEYDSVDSMMDDLRERSHSDNKAVAEEAEQILEKLYKKQAESKKSHEFEVELDLGKIGKEKREKGLKIYEEITKNSRGQPQ